MLLLLLACHAPPPADELTWDPLVQRGELPDGVDWYVEPGARPDNRAELRLVVKVGSGAETDAERGYAHIVEHMAFNGTTHFPKQELVHFIESSGMRFGADLNAATTVDSTIYKLQVATDDPTQMARAFTWFADIASGITFDAEEARSERKVVHEEWRTSLGFRARAADAMFPALWIGTPWAQRLPIGTEASILGAEAAPLRAFWERWYRPELMAVVVAGTVKPADVASALTTAFAAVPARTGPPAVVPAPTLDTAPQVVAMSEAEAPGDIVTLMARAPRVESWSAADTRGKLVDDLAIGVLNERLGDRARDPEGPLLGAQAASGRIQAGVQAWTLGGAARPGRTDAAVALLLDEVARLRQYGVTAGELERARAQRTTATIAYRDGASSETSSARVAELIRHVLYGEPVPGTAQESAVLLSAIPGITQAEVNAAAARLFPETGRILFTVQPATEPALTVDALRAELSRARSVTPPEDKVDAPLVPTPPEPGKVVAERKDADFDITEWTLSNGARVLLKPTAFVNDEIRFSMRSMGGYATVPEADYDSARLADEVAASSGLGELDPDALSRALAGKRAGVSVNLSSFSESMSGNCSPADVETMLQLAWLRVAKPRFTADGLARVLGERRARLATRLNDPDTIGGDKLEALLWDGAPHKLPWTAERLDHVQLAAIERVYRARLADAGDFTFVFVGDFDPAALRPLVERWLGSLPGAARAPEAWSDDGIRYRTGPADELVRAGAEAKATVTAVYPTVTTWTQPDSTRMVVLRDALSRRLREVIREGEGGTYGVKVSATASRFFPSIFLRVTFQCDPARATELSAKVDQVIADVRANGVSDDVVADIRAQLKRSREVELKDNGRWLDWLGDVWVEGAPRDLLSGYDQRVDAVTGDSIRAAAQAWLDPQRRVRVTRLPVAE